MKWTQEAWLSIQPQFDRITQHPFVQELMNGTLPSEKFIFYIEQDGLYLSDYGRLLTGIATQLNDPFHRKEFISFAGENMDQERELHAAFVDQINPNIEPTPACLLYTSHLLKHLAISPIEVTLAAVMPCFRVYQEVGLYISKHQHRINNPYQLWIDTYSDGEHIDSVQRVEAICNTLAQQTTPAIRAQMLKEYQTSVKLEYLFWDSAYKREKWVL
ncbi:TenA family protein [Bacteroides propionicifaciens]|jgi:thiaminase (transcriptional activator TenA)|uniref:TenA family protein n=1 Tax=Bacteroides propionicifaciens TaxID=392838 RepID=UPI00037103FC|nr:TenA family protein [Bacteroides propionicifaciens]